MNSNIVAFVFALMMGVSSAQFRNPLFVIGRGACPTVGTQAGFDLSRYLGDWYELERFPAIFEVSLECVKASYGDIGGGEVSVINQGFTRFSIFGQQVINRESVANGRATIPDPTKPAELSVSFSELQPTSSGPNYFVVETDYDNYSLVFSCSNVLGLNIQFAWVLTRQRGVAPANLAALKTTLSNAGVDVSNFKTTDQEGCTN